MPHCHSSSATDCAGLLHAPGLPLGSGSLMPTHFEAKTEELEGPIHKISVVGELDLDTAPILEAELRVAREADDASVLIDLSDCEFIDSSGLALIIQTWRELEQAEGTELAMCCAKEQ